MRHRREIRRIRLDHQPGQALGLRRRADVGRVLVGQDAGEGRESAPRQQDLHLGFALREAVKDDLLPVHAARVDHGHAFRKRPARVDHDRTAEFLR